MLPPVDIRKAVKLAAPDQNRSPIRSTAADKAHFGNEGANSAGERRGQGELKTSSASGEGQCPAARAPSRIPGSLDQPNPAR